MYLDFFDRKILDVLTKKGQPLTLPELVKDSGFARSTIIIHLERLGSEELILKEKRLRKGRGRPEFLYRPTDSPQPKATPKPNVTSWSSRSSKRPADTRKAVTANLQETNVQRKTVPYP